MKKMMVAALISFASSLAFAKAPLATFGSNSGLLPSLPHNFTILNWNIYKGGKDGMARDFSVISRDADVAVVQEAYETSQLLSDLTTANQQLSWNLVRGFKYQGYFTGVATGSRVTAIHTEGFLTTVVEPLLNSPKTMLLTVYPLANSLDSLAVLNVHGINFVLNSQFKKQVAQMIAILKNHRGPILAVGDFNTWNNGRMSALDTGFASIGLRRLILSNQKAPELDHAYLRGLVATEGSLLKQITSSDHKPILLKLQSGEAAFQVAN